MRYLQRGITVHDRERATPGFTLFSPQYRRAAHLINMTGEVVHEWTLPGQPGNYAYLLPNGNLLAATWAGGGPDGLAARGGLIQELDWNGNLVWEYKDEFQHHDFRRCPNGNTAYLGWEIMPEEYAARVRGGTGEHEPGEQIWGDYIREVDPDGNTVWEWRNWEHMEIENFPLPPHVKRNEFAHPNTLVPLENGNYLICFRQIDLIAEIDRESGAFAWSRVEHEFGGPHDFQLLPNGNFLIFANRDRRSPRGSAVIEFDREGKTIWEYRGNPSHTFDSHFISGCQRLESGDTLICEGSWGRIFEVRPDGDVVWEYISPFTAHTQHGGVVGDVSSTFRAYRYAPDGPEIQGRLDGKLN